MNKEIEIPEGYEARIEGNKVILEPKESGDERIRKEMLEYFKDKKEKLHYLCFECDDIKYAPFSEAKQIDDFIAYLEKQKAKEKYDRMAPIYSDQQSFEDALEKAWKFYNDSGSRTVDGLEDNSIELSFAKGFREGFLCKEKQKEQDKCPECCVRSNCIGCSIYEKLKEQKSFNDTQEYLKGVERVQGYDELTKYEKVFDRIADTYAHRKNKDGYNEPWYTKERAAEMLYHAKEELELLVEPKQEWMAGQFQKNDGDLEKEAEAYWKAQGGGSHAQWDKFRAVVKHFTEWQKEQMKEDALDGEITYTVAYPHHEDTIW